MEQQNKNTRFMFKKPVTSIYQNVNGYAEKKSQDYGDNLGIQNLSFLKFK